MNSVEETINSLIASSNAFKCLITELRQHFPWNVHASIENYNGVPYVEFRVAVPAKVSVNIVKAHLEEVFPWAYHVWKFVPAVDTGRGYEVSRNIWYRRISI